jgi:uncharacterized protein (DUF885 family)
VFKKLTKILFWFSHLQFLAYSITASAAGQASNTLAVAKAKEFFSQTFQERLALNPEWQAYLGIKTQYDKWEPLTPEHAAKRLALYKKQLAQLKNTLDYKALDAQNQLSYRLFQASTEQDIEAYKFRNYDYPVNQMFGIQAEVPSFLINTHQITNQADAIAYIKRLQAVKPLFQQLIAALQLRASQGIILPKFLFPYVLSDCQNVIRGEPFDQSTEDSPLWEDFKTKLAKLDLPAKQKAKLQQQAKLALLNSVKPAYRELGVYLQQLQQKANDDAGVWKFPQGEAYYQFALKNFTTTSLSAAEIHNLGLQEVKRIQAEMHALIAKIGFKGSLQDFLHTLHDPKFFFPNTAAGRQAYLAETNVTLDTMKAKLPSLFNIQPKAELVIKRVEAYREQSAGMAFYQPPAADNSRPGIYYVNLENMAQMPRYELAALAYHEGIPGHHLQLSIANELTDIADFRKYGNYTAYIEGWGLYAELLPKEIGFYQDPYADFGRLSMELMRASRLVVDTGIHALHWTRDKAIAYLDENLPTVHAENVKSVERYIVMPGQATAYKIGMLKLLALREEARQKLGVCFDIRGFHDIVLKSGPLPLDVLEQEVHAWIEQQKNCQS